MSRRLCQLSYRPTFMGGLRRDAGRQAILVQVPDVFCQAGCCGAMRPVPGPAFSRGDTAYKPRLASRSSTFCCEASMVGPLSSELLISATLRLLSSAISFRSFSGVSSLVFIIRPVDT